MDQFNLYADLGSKIFLYMLICVAVLSFFIWLNVKQWFFMKIVYASIAMTGIMFLILTLLFVAIGYVSHSVWHLPLQ
jgi:hypothetical protein